MTNCLNCGAPITGDVCEYCGTRHDTGFTVRMDIYPRCSPSELFSAIERHSRYMQQCSREELEKLRDRNAREAVNVFSPTGTETQRFLDALNEKYLNKK